MDTYCKPGHHVWENKPTFPGKTDVYQCNKCPATAKNIGGHMVTIMCSDLGCLNPAWRPQQADDTIWVCEDHYVGVILA